MKTKKTRLALSILAGGLSFVGTANAGNLLLNSSFETYSGGGNVYGQRGTNDWVGFFSQYNNTTQAYFDGPNIPSGENPGSMYSWRQAAEWSAWGNFVTPEDPNLFLQNEIYAYALTQTVALTNGLTTTGIDSGQAQYTFSGWMASYNSNPEQPYLVLRFFNDAATSDSATGTQIGGNVILDRTTNTFAVTFASGNTNIPADVSNDHNWIKYVATGTVPAGARKARVYVTRSPNIASTGSPDTYIDLVKLDVLDLSQTTVVDSAAPANGATGVSPAAVVSVTLKDVNTQVNTNTIQLQFDGGTVSPVILKSGIFTTITYDPPGLLPAASPHTYRLVWSDNGVSVTTRTNLASFTVAPYVNIVTGPAIYQEPFDEVAEGSLPAGWSASNTTDSDLPGSDLNNFHSDSYLDWTVISRSTLSNLFTVVPSGNYYVPTLNVAPNQWLNGSPVTNLINTNFALAASAGRFGNQVQYLTTADYNLSGKANVHLVFSDIFATYNNNIASVEYSINGGSTWLPALYLMDSANIIRDGNGNIDASNTLATAHAGVPSPGNFGAFIGVAQAQWAGLANYISGRTSTDLTSSMRVEAIRLAQADNQAAVRFRFAQAAANSYYFGMDDFGLYSIVPDAPFIITAPATQAAALGNSASLSVTAGGLGPLSYQWRHNGTNLPSNTGSALALPVIHSTDAGTYDVIVSNSGGSVTSTPPAVLSVINPLVLVSGQWDFISNNLAASYGTSMQFYNATVQADTTFGSTTSMGIPDINGAPTTVMHFTPSVASWGGYKLFHGALPNGGGVNVNQYTLIYDIYYPGSSDFTYRALWQTDIANASDADVFINPADGLGITSIYNGYISAGEWHRVAFAFDLSGPGQAPVLTKFVDGVKVGNQTTGLSAKDGRFSVGTYGLLFADNDGDTAEGYVSSVQFSNGRRPDAFIQALGGPSALKIPGAIRSDIVGGSVVIRWSGGVPLQEAGSISGPWTTVPGLTPGQFTYVVPAGPTKYYRPQIP